MMTLGEEDGVATLTLDDGRANAIGRAFLAELNEKLDEIERSPAHALVVFGRPGIYSAGLDLKELPDLPPDELTRTAGAFVEAMRRLFLFPKPIIAAADGHAIAGGMMIYLSADVRVAVDRDDVRMGLNEAVTGIPITAGTAALCTTSIPPQHHNELILHGRLLSPRETFERGITDELVSDAADLERASIARAKALADVDPEAYHLNKRILREPAWESAVARSALLRADASTRNLFESIRR